MMTRVNAVEGPDRTAGAPQTCELSTVCPECGADMDPEHAHYRCPSCGYRDSCCF